MKIVFDPTAPPTPKDDLVSLANVGGKLALLRGGAIIVDDVERVAKLMPRMLELLAEGSAPNDNPWSHELWRRRVHALLAEIDGD